MECLAYNTIQIKYTDSFFVNALTALFEEASLVKPVKYLSRFVVKAEETNQDRNGRITSLIR